MSVPPDEPSDFTPQPRSIEEQRSDHTRSFISTWSQNDLEGTLAHFCEDVTYHLHLDPALLPFAGESVGKSAVREAFVRMRKDYDYILFRPINVMSDTNGVRARVEFMLRHKASGAVYSGKSRLIFAFSHGLISRIDEYHDEGMIRAFLGLFDRE